MRLPLNLYDKVVPAKNHVVLYSSTATIDPFWRWTMRTLAPKNAESFARLNLGTTDAKFQVWCDYNFLKWIVKKTCPRDHVSTWSRGKILGTFRIFRSFSPGTKYQSWHQTSNFSRTRFQTIHIWKVEVGPLVTNRQPLSGRGGWKETTNLQMSTLQNKFVTKNQQTARAKNQQPNFGVSFFRRQGLIDPQFNPPCVSEIILVLMLKLMVPFRCFGGDFNANLSSAYPNDDVDFLTQCGSGHQNDRGWLFVRWVQLHGLQVPLAPRTVESS